MLGRRCWLSSLPILTRTSNPKNGNSRNGGCPSEKSSGHGSYIPPLATTLRAASPTPFHTLGNSWYLVIQPLTGLDLLTLSHASPTLPQAPRRAFIKGWRAVRSARRPRLTSLRSFTFGGESRRKHNHKPHRLRAALRTQDKMSIFLSKNFKF